MKRQILLTTLYLLSGFIYSQQEVKLTVETMAGGLKEALTKEQKQTVTDLTLTGSMNDSDFYLIRDSMPILKRLDIKYVDVDTIPKKGFYESKCGRCVLPVSLKYIDDEAFKETYCHPEITGEFPKLGAGILGDRDRYNRSFYVSGDNIYCKSLDYGIYSANGKIFYFQDTYNSIVEEGTEIIESRAFEGATYTYYIRLPSTLKLIKEFCFVDTRYMAVCSLTEYSGSAVICDAVIPPVLEDNAFVDEFLLHGKLIVPKGSIDLYKQSDSQWNQFSLITDDLSEIPIGAIQNSQGRSLITTKEGNGWNIKAEKSIHTVWITNSLGTPCMFERLNNNSVFIPFNHSRDISIIKILFEDDTICNLKLLN